MNGFFKKLKYAALACMTLLAPQAYANVSGAIWTSTGDGIVVDENVHYAGKQFVYLNGGSQNQQGAGIEAGYYYFQVTTPDNVLLSTDSPYCRLVRVDVVNGNGRFATSVNPQDVPAFAGTPSMSCKHANGLPNAANGSVPVQLIPYLNTTNSGGEYKAWLISVNCKGDLLRPADTTTPVLNFSNSCSKTDNFKVDNVCSVGVPNEFGICPCPDNPEVYPVDGVCPCPNGGTPDSSGVCCPDNVPSIDGVCPCPGTTDQVPDANGQCCPDGAASDSLGHCPCLPLTDPPRYPDPITGLCQIQCPADLKFTIGGVKFLDANANGTNEGETPIQGVEIDIAYGGNTYTVATNEFGEWSRLFTFAPNPTTCVYPDAIPFSVCEAALPGQWLQTGPLEGVSTGTDTGASANPSMCWSGTVPVEDGSDLGMYFGNVCYGVGGGGLTKGFWHNKNGNKLINTPTNGYCFQYLTGKNMVKANGDSADPLFTYATIGSFDSWLTNDSSAKNMANMLSTQLAAMILNVKCGGNVADTALIFSDPDSANNLFQYGIGQSNGVVSINDLIAAGVAALSGHSYTPDGDPYRAKQAAIKDALDAANNNLNFLGNASNCPKPDDWAFITLPQ
jgi:hypothetical protein